MSDESIDSMRDLGRRTQEESQSSRTGTRNLLIGITEDQREQYRISREAANRLSPPVPQATGFYAFLALLRRGLTRGST